MRRLRHIGAGLAILGASLLSSQAPAEITLESTVQYALENLISGAAAKAELGETDVAVTPIRTWKSVTGHWCRRYEVVVTAPDADADADRTEATRCRQDGIWKRLPQD